MFIASCREFIYIDMDVNDIMNTMYVMYIYIYINYHGDKMGYHRGDPAVISRSYVELIKFPW